MSFHFCTANPCPLCYPVLTKILDGLQLPTWVLGTPQDAVSEEEDANK